MFTKYYEKVRKFIKENYLYLLFYFVLATVLLYPLPYYIYNGGGIIDVDKRIEIENEYDSEGSFNLCYVSEIKATISTYLLAKVLPGWDIIEAEEVTMNDNETDEDVFTRDRIFLNDANMNAIKVAYQKSGKEFSVTDIENYVIYLTEDAETNLKIGDKIKDVEGIKISSLDELKEIVKEKQLGDKISFTVERKKKEEKCYALVMEVDGVKQIGVAIQNNYSYETNPSIQLKFASNESGPSGGLLLSLSIYNLLIPEDITDGKKIAGTGTIDAEGNVGSIGGVKYKLKGAVSSGADIFLVPNGENYQEAISLKKKHDYDIKIIGVSTFEEALEKLKEM